MAKHRPDALFIRVLVSSHGDQWLAEGLEKHLTAQAPSWRQAINSFIRILRRRLQMDRQHGVEPLSTVAKAPEHLFDAWAKLLSQLEEDDLVTHSVSRTPEAYVIHENAKRNAGPGVNA
jgi:hypothetical protein